MLEAETNNEWTILDYLDEDCWRAVLQFVPVQDIVKSERVSRRWQQVVLLYLKGTRFSFVSIEVFDYADPSNAFMFILPKSMYESFESWTTKLGKSVAGTYCMNHESLKKLTENCPNLEALTLIKLDEPKASKKRFQQNLIKHLQCVKQLCFSTSNISDRFVSQSIADKALEELEFHDCYEITGECLISANLSNLKFLAFKMCLQLQARHIISFTNQLGELTKLELIDIPKNISKKIQLVLDKMPKLEWLEINTHRRRMNPCYLVKYEPLCRLSHLKYLNTNLKVTDESVEAITRCCKELQTLELGDCECLNSEGLEAICRNAGNRLTELGLQFFCYLEDDDVVNCVRSCPELTSLTIGGPCQITPAMPARVSAARHEVSPGQQLCLDLSETNLSNPEGMEEFEDIEEEYEDLCVYLS